MNLVDIHKDDFKATFPPFHGQTTNYLICSSYRTGSSLLGNLFFKTDLLGRPVEYFNNLVIPEELRRLSSDFEVYMKLLQERYTTPNGYFGVKAHFIDFSRVCCCSSASRVLKSIKYFIYTTRKNTLKQAISYFKAYRSNKWNSTHELGVCLSEVDYDFNALRYIIGFLQYDVIGWETFFKTHSITPLHVVYEDFSDNINQTMHKACEYLEVPYTPVAPTLKKQADQLSQFFYAQFISDASSKNVPIPDEWRL